MEHEDNRELWRKDLENWLSSGMTITAWCKENNVSYNTFQYRRKRLGNSHENRENTRFIELQEESCADSGVRVAIKGISLQLSEQFDETVLLRCLRVIRSL